MSTDARTSHDARTKLERQVADQRRRARAAEDHLRRRESEDVLRALSVRGLHRDPAMPASAIELLSEEA